jgi:hypothetical protein
MEAPMPTAADLVFVFALFVLATVYEYVYFWPHFRAAAAAGRMRAPGAIAAA